MLLVSYDFSDDHVRTKFSKFLGKFGRRIQYSVFEIRNSERVLKNILKEIDLVYKKLFNGSDSIVIFPIGDCCKKKIRRFGWNSNEEEDVIVFN